MSLRATKWAWSVSTNSTAKLVLVALAEHADEAGLCWPSIARLSEFTCLSERAIRNALRDLERAELIATDQRGGRLSRYMLRIRHAPEPRHDVPGSEAVTPAPDAPHPGTTCPPTPAPDAGDPGTTCRTPRHDVPLTPAPRAPEPSRTVIEPSVNRQAVVRTPGGARLPADWQPSGDDEVFATSLGLDAQRIADSFRDYWAAQPGARGRKSDWPATWRIWCRREAERPARNANPPPRKSNMSWLIESMKEDLR